MFLNPLLLYGLIGVSVPIIIHLMNRRKFQRVRWAAMRFIMTSVQKNRRRMQIEDLLLLLLRCLIVALLACVLARPILERVGMLGRQPVTAVILLDNSYSLAKTDGLKTRFGEAKKAADEVVANLPAGSQASLFLFSNTVRDVIPSPTSDLALVREKIRQATLSDHATDVFAGLQRAQAALAATPGLNREIYVITDGQATGWHRGGSGGGGDGGRIVRLLQETKDAAATRVILVTDADTKNLAVTAVRLTTELPTVNKVLRFEVEVTNFGEAVVREVPVRLFVDEGALPVEEAVVDVVPARGSKSVSLHARLRGEGFHAVTARVAGDLLGTDDARSVVVNALKQVRVLLVNGESGREGREEDVYFVREAMQPVGVESRPNYFIQTRTITASEMAQTSLDSYDAVVLANVASLPRTMAATLEKFVGDGRGLIVFPGPNVTASFYNDQLYKERSLLPAALGEAVGDSNQGERFEVLQSTRFEHPIMTLWNDEGRGNPAVAHFFRMYDLRMDATSIATAPATTRAAEFLPGKPAVVASFANGKPAILERTFGDGRVVLFASTANTQWNDLPVRASIFIPMMHRVLDSILERQDEQLAISVGDSFSHRMSSATLGKEAQITRLKMPGSGDTSEGPAAPDAVRIDMQDRWPMIAYDRTELAGIYRVAVSETPDDPILFAVQADTAESDLLPLSPMEMGQINAVAPVIQWKPGATATPVAVAETGREIWWPLAVALLAIACLESVLATWFSRVK
jgi:hypothetical protein